MRQIGTLASQNSAQRFAAYLITQGIHATAEDYGDGQWAVWVRDEDRLQDARSRLEEFTSDPEAAKYQAALREANTVMEKQARQREQARKNQVDVRGMWSTPSLRRAPLVTAILMGTVAVFLLTIGGGYAAKLESQLKFCDLQRLRDPDSPADPLAEIRQGQVWRLVTPALLHGGPLHLGFNLLMFYYLATPIELRKGAARLALLFLLLAASSTTAQALAPAEWGPLGGSPNVVGMSGVVYGLLGYLWMKGANDAGDGLDVPPGTLAFLLFWLFLGFSGILDLLLGARVANVAHGAGLLAGMLIGYASAMLRRQRS